MRSNYPEGVEHTSPGHRPTAIKLSVWDWYYTHLLYYELFINDHPKRKRDNGCKKSIQITQNLLEAPNFQTNHKRQVTDFTRNRKLNFVSVMLVLFQKSAKSLQLVLNELSQRFLFHSTVSNSAFSQARLKLKHTAFIELNQKAIVEVRYEEKTYRTWKGHRLLAIDGMQVPLPDSESIRQAFGTQSVSNQYETCQGDYPLAIASVLYDVLNHIGLDAQLAHSKSYEVNLAVEHLKYTQANDLLIFDRNYLSFYFLAVLTSQRRDFLIRAQQASFLVIQEMFTGDIEDQIVTLKVPRDQKSKMRSLHLPTEIQLRLLRVVLDNGEVEVLVTSLLDQKQYPLDEFKALYARRWGVETFYSTLKGRLTLENFTGTSAEAVRQDFFATIYISGLESILTENADEILKQKSLKNRFPQQVNKAVAFNAIKNRVFEIFAEKEDLDTTLEELTQLFLTNPVLIRKERSPERKKSIRRSYHYQKRVRKFIF